MSAARSSGEEAGVADAGEFPKLSPTVSFFSLFLFEKFLLLNPAAPYKEGLVLTQPTSPARLGTVQVSTLHGPTLNSPQPVHTISVGLPLHP